MGPLLQEWLNSQNATWQAEEEKRQKAEAIQRAADEQAPAKFMALTDLLRELKNQPIRGTKFGWSNEYHLLYRDFCVRLRSDSTNDRFVGLVTFSKPQEPPIEEWRLAAATTKPGGEFGWIINGWSNAPDMRPKNDDAVAKYIAERLVTLDGK